LLEALVEERAPAGAVLLAQGQPNDHLSFLIGGSATVERARPRGLPEVIATLHAPSVFGTTTFFTPRAPTFSVRAATDVWLLTLHHPAHARLRRDHPRAAEALAVAAVRVLSDRFNELDELLSQHMREHTDDAPRVNEWAGFRARLFEEPAD
jgi:CRP-like cAMP-binding protein